MKKIIYIIFFIIYMANSLNAMQNNKLALKLQQAKKIDLVLQRVNTLFEFINLYILETAMPGNLDGSFTANMSALTSRYGSLQNESFIKNQTINFKVNTSTITRNSITLVMAQSVTFSNIVPNQLPSIVRQLYKNNINLHPQAVVNVDNSMTIALNPETLQFINYTNMLLQLKQDPSHTFVGIPSPEPQCTGVTQQGNVWYQPNGIGGFITTVCINHSGTWFFEFLSEKLDIVLVQNLQSELTQIEPVVGTVGYYNKINVGDSGANMYKMIYVHDIDGDGIVDGLNGWVVAP